MDLRVARRCSKIALSDNGLSLDVVPLACREPWSAIKEVSDGSTPS